MLSNFSKLKWLVLFLLLPMTGIAANTDGFTLQLKGPEAQTPSSPTSYGPVAKSDTLWSIAKATRPNSSLSLYQTMAAILALNPHAFLDGDINKMIDGSILKIPSSDQIRATDGSRLQQALNQPVNTLSAKSITSAKPVAATSKPASVARAIVRGESKKLTQLQDELAESNEHFLLSSETNRRLKLQLESIRVELAELTQQMELDNQLKTELKALVEQQHEQISLQQALIDDATNKAVIKEENSSNSWLIISVSGGFIFLSLVWLGLWLKNRHDQKMHAEDAAIFDADNAVDELSEYLTTENYTATDPFADSAAENGASEAVNTLVKLAPEDEADFNRQLPDELQATDAAGIFADDTGVSAPVNVEITASEPIIPEIIEQLPTITASAIAENNFSDIDLTLDDVNTSFDNDNITPDLSWREELDSDEIMGAEEPNLIPEQPAADDDALDMSNSLDADLAEIDNMLAQYRPAPDEAVESQDIDTRTDFASASGQQNVDADAIDSILAEAELAAMGAMSEAVELPQAHGQTVDEMLAELDNTMVQKDQTELDNRPVQANAGKMQEPAPKAIGKGEQLDDIEAMLAEYSPNAFSNAPSEQAPIDPVAAKQEEFIDIDKLLNESALAADGMEDEPYDQVTLDVGLDEYRNTLLDHNDVDIDDDSNTISAQLDLARAYLEIEDKEGAKSILDPLAGTGNAAQQAEVNKLLSRL